MTPSQERRAEYDAYLNSATWQTKRKLALERAGHRCQLCAIHSGPFDVHHNTYERFGGAELPEDLTVLCRSCHDHFHDRAQPRRAKRKYVRHAGQHPTAVKAEERTLIFDALAPGREYLTRDVAALVGLTNQRAGSLLASLRRSRIVSRRGKVWTLRKTAARAPQRDVAAMHAQLERELDERIRSHVTPIRTSG